MEHLSRHGCLCMWKGWSGVTHVAESSKNWVFMVYSLLHLLPCPKCVDFATVFPGSMGYIATQKVAVVGELRRVIGGSQEGCSLVDTSLELNWFSRIKHVSIQFCD